MSGHTKFLEKVGFEGQVRFRKEVKRAREAGIGCEGRAGGRGHLCGKMRDSVHWRRGRDSSHWLKQLLIP